MPPLYGLHWIIDENDDCLRRNQIQLIKRLHKNRTRAGYGMLPEPEELHRLSFDEAITYLFDELGVRLRIADVVPNFKIGRWARFYPGHAHHPDPDLCMQEDDCFAIFEYALRSFVDTAEMPDEDVGELFIFFMSGYNPFHIAPPAVQLPAVWTDHVQARFGEYIDAIESSITIPILHL